MNIRELIERLEEVAEEHGDDTLIIAAVQPNYPLAQNIAGVSVTGEDLDDAGDGMPVVWIAVSDSHPSGLSPYAPHEAFDVRY